MEHYTKALAKRKEGVTLAGALQEMADLVANVGESAKTVQSVVPKAYVDQVEQLALFVMESKAKYEDTARKKQQA